jgi:hypothetical protein
VKKVITPKQRAQMMAGVIVAQKLRRETAARQELRADIKTQLAAAESDVVVLRRLASMVDKAVTKQEWTSAFRLATALSVWAGNIAKRIELTTAKVDALNKIEGKK